ncbi:MAG: 2-C-methyl-D-erythritol 2,4-cyclodiphosphate synthase [Albidovulum sp.]|nr:2-C-methyl-D-erythritol 2,4-cyclodiphosphate synthase [Albidovulum sp.]
MNLVAIVPAAGRGERAGSGKPKQYRDLGGMPILARVIDSLISHPAISDCTAIICSDHEPLFENLVEPRLGAKVKTVSGGTERQVSVRNGLATYKNSDATHVLIHDGARPFLSAALIDRVVDALKNHDGAVPVLMASDALWRETGGFLDKSVPRAGILCAQTPQGFAFPAILDAHDKYSGPAHDDAAVAVRAGMRVAAVRGCPANEKITTREDYFKASRAMEKAPDFRVGQGFDVHRFGPGSSVVLCGVEIPHSRGLIGHSDADAAMHAIADAIYGALGARDIGHWFPPDDSKWKNASSAVFLNHACELAAEKGYAVSSLDCTIICQGPQIGPHVDDMKLRLSACLGIDPQRIGVKATTAERLGAIGREEGIAAMAVATLKSK